MIREASGKAEAIKLEAEAKAAAIRLINESQPSRQYLAIRSMEATEKMANGQATKLIVPSDLQSIVSSAAVIKEGTETVPFFIGRAARLFFMSAFCPGTKTLLFLQRICFSFAFCGI